ncbi:hypothetical protein GCM10011608_10750 [Micromonospora sonchi]|uniref:Uncharacterized protein n=1 Tax=Micromonospora sonchi TaxID=1763543 RepID=A0A917TMP6_9ACTN|nr:hypothetical protein [Micromonospora sonchi]GGM27789.1 hypothetical protein GCM10011608_10750 [Micromonospora sonchi]
MTDTSELDTLRAENARLRQTVLNYRWANLARDLVIANRTRHNRNHTTRLLETVIHETGCRHVPAALSDDHIGRMDGTYWQVNNADGVSLRTAMAEPRTRVCGTCRPDVDPSTALDGAGTLPVHR